MTSPKISTISRSGSRFYIHPETTEKVPGVTSVLGMLPKGFLKYWASKVVAESAVEHLGEIVSIAMRDPQGAIDFLKRAPDRNTGKAANMGTEVHDLYERLAKGEPAGRLHPELKVYADHFDAFVKEFKPEFIFLEETVWSEKHLYAGSFDVLATIDGETVFGDWKTTRSGVHEEVALQLAAYRHADYIVRPDGSRVPMPKADGGFVLHARPEGWSLVPAKCDEEVFRTFLHLREVFRWENEGKKAVLGTPLNANPNNVKKRATPARRAA